MDKPTWLLFDEQERTEQLNGWLTELLTIENAETITGKDRETKKALEKNIFNVLEWMQDYD